MAHERRNADVRHRPPPAHRGPGRLATVTSSTKVRELYARERDEIEARIPKLQRRVAGYDLDLASSGRVQFSRSSSSAPKERLGLFRKIKLKLAPLPTHKVLGVVHFPTFYQAMDLTRHIVGLGPTAVELVDRTIIELSRDIAAFRATMDKTIRGEPDAILLVEFAGDEQAAELTKLRRLTELMADLGLPGSVIEIVDVGWQRDVWEVRKAGLNIMMSMKGDGKPVLISSRTAPCRSSISPPTPSALTQVFAKRRDARHVLCPRVSWLPARAAPC